LHPLCPFWLDGNTILFSGINVAGGQWLPVGIYSVSLSAAKVTRLLDGRYLAPFVCDFGKTLYFSWGPTPQTEKPAKDARPPFNDFSGFHIWRVPLRDVLAQHSGELIWLSKGVFRSRPRQFCGTLRPNRRKLRVSLWKSWPRSAIHGDDSEVTKSWPSWRRSW